MKIVCSSKYLKKAIKKVLKEEHNSIKTVKITHGSISFGHITVSTEDDLSNSYHDVINFYPIRWYRIMKFMEHLPEQPISLAIYEDLIDIYCVARF